MNNLQLLISNYLEYCKTQKRLDEKTLKAYIIDLKQFSTLTSCKEITMITPNTLETHIAQLHQQYKPKTVKRKIASLKAFFTILNTRISSNTTLSTKSRCAFENLSSYPKPYHCIPLKHFYQSFIANVTMPRRIIKKEML